MADLNDEIAAVLACPTTSYWLRQSLEQALARDCVDAANDAELLSTLLAARCVKKITPSEIKSNGAFRETVISHVATLTNEQFVEYTRHGEDAVLVASAADTYFGVGAQDSRAGHVDNALHESYQAPSEYFNTMLEEQYEIVGHAPNAVYFFPAMGVYAMGLDDSVLDVWLSWPAYPRRWFKDDGKPID